MSVLNGNNPVHRGRTLRQTSHGLTSTKENATSTSGPGILLDFTDPRTSLQANRKTHEGADHPDRDAQFELINQTAKTTLAAGEPVISVDTKKTELIGQFKNGGRQWAPAGTPVEVNTHDFPSQAEGKAIPTASTTSPTTRAG